MRVALVPTGRTEWHGMGAALARLFPAHDFYAVPSPEEMDSHPEGFPCNGFTSSRLTKDAPLPEAARDLVERAAQEALGDRRREAADLVVVIDDLELTNADQPEQVVRVFRKAVEQHLGGLGRHAVRTAAVLQEKVSFHLIVPMIEAWFFGRGISTTPPVRTCARSPALVGADPMQV